MKNLTLKQFKKLKVGDKLIFLNDNAELGLPYSKTYTKYDNEICEMKEIIHSSQTYYPLILPNFFNIKNVHNCRMYWCRFGLANIDENRICKNEK